MSKLFEKIKNSSKKSKIIAVVLATAVCVTSIWHNWGEEKAPVANAAVAAGSKYTKNIDVIIDRMIGGLQENFTILEIVPQTAQGEFRYYVGDEAVNEGLEARQDLLERYFGTLGFYKDNGVWKNSDPIEPCAICWTGSNTCQLQTA